MTGRVRTCDAPRFRRALYPAELRSRDGRSRSRTGDLLRIREALSLLSYTPLALKWTGRESNPRTTASFAAATTTARLLCRALSYPAHRFGRGVEPRSPRSERGVLPG